MDRFLAQLWMARDAIVGGVLISMEAALTAIVIGSLLGLVIGLLLVYGHVVLRVLCRIYVDIIRGTPVLVLILAAFYITPAVGLQMDAFQAGLLALSLFCGAHLGEIVRVGELLLKTQEIVGRNFMTLEFYAVAGVLYLLINLGIETLGRNLEARVRP